MKKLFLIYTIAFNLAFSLPITENFAIEISENFYYSKNDRRTSEFSIENTEIYSNDTGNIFHVIHLNPEGFILISADNSILPVLGYSFENNYRTDNIPTNITYLFNLYSKQIIEQRDSNNQDDYIATQWEKFSNPVEYEGQNRSVSPLISARFDQGTPWNDMCPEDPDGPGGNVLVGCVAVSMAQIMHYWSYPPVGSGSHGYTHWEYGYQYADYGNSTYNYDDMPNNYGTPETAKLLYHAGVAVNMGYGVDGSGANVFGNGNTSERAMKDYFLFKNDLYDIDAGSYSTSQYRSLLQNELNNNRPIIYVGYSDDGGHAWNIDGYDDEYFHNNWGWGGSQNGYFLLSSLNGFDYSQGALINMEPQSLNNPNVLLESFTYEEAIGDGDSVVNPGETIQIYLTIENLVPWNDASSIELLLSTQDDEIIINNSQITIYNLDAGESRAITTPFTITLADDAALTNHEIQLNILSFGSNGEYNENEHYLNFDVSLSQAGFPYRLSLIDDNGESYEAVTVIQSSPLLIDVNDDNINEIFFGDDAGFFHGINYLGNSLNGFPIELESSANEIWGSPAAADIDNDGEIEFVITSKNKHCYIIDQYGNIELDFETNQFLMATPSLLNIDSDDDLEIAFYGYTSSGDVHVINHDGTYVNNFPAELDEKVLKGGAIYDFDNNGKDDIVVATENEKSIFIIFDNGNIEQIFTSNDKFKSAPSVVNHNGQTLILVGDEGGLFYGLSPNGDLEFSIITGDKIKSSAGFIEIDNNLKIFFGSEDGKIYGIDINGNNLDGWPQTIVGGISGNAKINSTPVFADINNDGDIEIICASEEGQLIIYKLDGTTINNYPMQFNLGFISSPTILDLDNDNDMEIIIGTNQNLSVIDLKTTKGESDNLWNTYRGDNHRTGTYQSENNLLSGDLNNDVLINVQDLVMLINIIIGNSSANNNQLTTGDLNNDNTLDVLDVVLLVNIILEA